MTSQSYASCATSQDVTESGIPTGTGSEQVALTLAAGTYTIAAKSASGNTFTITKAASGPVTRTCTTANSGGCKTGGVW